MKKQTWLFALLFSFSTLSFPLMYSVHAESTFDAPNKKESTNWVLELNPYSKDKNLVQPDKEKYDVYSMDIINNDKKKYNVNVSLFRDGEDKDIQYGLGASSSSPIPTLNKGDKIHLDNFPIYNKAHDMEVVITWEDKSIKVDNGKTIPGRTYKQVFNFHKNTN